MIQIIVNAIGTLILIVLLVIDIANNTDDCKENRMVRLIIELSIVIGLLLFNLFVGTYYGS